MAKLTKAHVDALLDKLSSDDAFRTQFQKNPKAALKAIGAPEEAAACCTVTTLADKKTIQNTRAKLSQQLTGTLAQNVHDLDAK
jgi:putative modified peptide